MLCLSQRFYSQTALVVAALLLALLHNPSIAIEAQSSEPNASQQSSSPKPSSAKKTTTNSRRMREGAELINESGFFRFDGEGATFVSDNGYEFGGLANLNLQRVVRVLKNAEDSQYVRWMVSGTVTEFSDRNFLLISRAVYKSAAHPPLPEQLE